MVPPGAFMARVRIFSMRSTILTSFAAAASGTAGWE
jgi:hypothetical protein